MKKLLSALAIIATAVSANAASMVWSSDVGGILLPSGDYADGNVTMYLYEITASEYAGFSGTADEISKAVYAAYGTSGSANVIDDWGVAQITDSRDFAVGNTAYAAVVFTYNDGDNDYYKANIGSYTFVGATDGLVASLDANLGGNGIAVGDSGAISWQSVPEPTTGLLLLLGMAGLALRRRRV